jgi:hypothetical protein
MDNEEYRQNRAKLGRQVMQSAGLSNTEIVALLHLEAVAFILRRQSYNQEEFDADINTLWDHRPALADYLQTILHEKELVRKACYPSVLEDQITEFIETAAKVNQSAKFELISILIEDDEGLARTVINKLFDFAHKKGNTMKLHQIEQKIKELKAEEDKAVKRLQAISNRSKYNLKLETISSNTGSAYIDDLANQTVWDTLRANAEEKLTAARKAITDFENQFQDNGETK